jgi:PKD repeat protein
MGLGLAAVLSATGCTVKETSAPEVTGPSELGLSVTVTANPDVLKMDGISQSTITIQARNANSQVVPNMGFRAEVIHGGEIRDDMGRLSTKSGVTASDGKASLTFTAPTSAASGNSDSGGLIVSVRVIPAGTDYSNATPRSVDLRLLPEGDIQPLPNTPIAAFVFSPTSPKEGDAVAFDAATSRDCPPDAPSVEACPVNPPTLTTFAWDFGDGTRGNGVRASHVYERPGSYTVTLTVSNQRGLQNSASKFVTVDASSRPSASFVASPESAGVNQTVFFNAAASTAATGRTIVSYGWDFGDGSNGSGLTTSHRYSRTGTFNVTLTVTDDMGKVGATSKGVTVGASAVPTAVIANSPAAPTTGQNVNFDGTQSTVPSGRRITSYEWAFGDGRIASGDRVTHTYSTAGDYTVILTVTDDSGAKATASKSISVSDASSAGPTAQFTVSPAAPTVNAMINFDASQSTARAGSNITVYEWNFGDNLGYYQCPVAAPMTPPCSTDAKRIQHAYGAAGSYTVTLTVTDSQGRKGTVTRSVQVQ